MRRSPSAPRFRSRAGLAAALVTLLACGGDGDGDGDGAGPGAGGPCQRPPGGPAHGAHVLRFEGGTPLVRVHLSRKLDGAGPGESLIYGLQAFSIERDGACTNVDAAARLSYENTHHNWSDVASATAGDLTYRLEMDFDLFGPSTDDTWRFTLTARRAGGDGGTTFGPVTLRQTGGPVSFKGSTGLVVHVSEVAPAGGTSVKDEAGEAEPWLELFNPGSEAVDLGGYLLSNDPERPALWALPPGTTIGRHQHLVVIADGEPTEGPLHASFRLSASGGAIRLSSPDGRSNGERAYGATAAGKSAAFRFGAEDDFAPAAAPTPGKPAAER
jgi:hypothetical protein